MKRCRDYVPHDQGRAPAAGGPAKGQGAGGKNRAAAGLLPTDHLQRAGPGRVYPYLRLLERSALFGGQGPADS